MEASSRPGRAEAGCGADVPTPARHGSRRAPPWAVTRAVCIDPGVDLPYDEVQWRDALAFVARGVIELVGMAGGRCLIEEDGMFWLTDAPLRLLHNPGAGTTVLVAVARRFEAQT